MKKKVPWLLLGLLSLGLFILGNMAAITYRMETGEVLEKFNAVLSERLFQLAPGQLMEQVDSSGFLVGFLLVAALWLFYLYNFGGRRNFKEGEEHGSARWASPAEARRFTEKKPEDNILLAEDVGLALYNKRLSNDYHTNKNILVIGGPGSGKTRFYVKPNVLQAHACYVITDPKGTVMPEVGGALSRAGYAITTFNTIDFSKSMHYNPFHYIQKEADILRFVEGLIANTTSPDNRAGEQFWTDAEKLLYNALIGYIIFEAPEREKNFETFLSLFEDLEVREDDEEYTCAVDVLFEELATNDQEHFAVRQYSKFKKAAGKTAKSILISCGARLSPFDIAEVREILRYDELHFDRIGFQKTAFFIVLDDYDPTFNFLVGVMYTQLFNILIRNADSRPDGALPIHTRVILDEFANTGQIPNFEKLSGQIRSREVSVEIILQSPEQLNALYRNGKANTITGNCDTMLFLGSGDTTVGKYVSERVGKTTIDHMGHSEQRGSRGSSSRSEHIVSRDLIDPNEITKMPVGECIVTIKGLPPIKAKKYDLKKHPRYRMTAEAGKGGRFDPFSGDKDRGVTAVEALEDFLNKVERIVQAEV